MSYTPSIQACTSLWHPIFGLLGCVHIQEIRQLLNMAHICAVHGIYCTLLAIHQGKILDLTGPFSILHVTVGCMWIVKKKDFIRVEHVQGSLLTLSSFPSFKGRLPRYPATYDVDVRGQDRRSAADRSAVAGVAGSAPDARRNFFRDRRFKYKVERRWKQIEDDRRVTIGWRFWMVLVEVINRGSTS